MLLRSRLNKAKCWPELINKGLEKEMSQEQNYFTLHFDWICFVKS